MGYIKFLELAGTIIVRFVYNRTQLIFLPRNIKVYICIGALIDLSAFFTQFKIRKQRKTCCFCKFLKGIGGREGVF